MDPQPPTEAAPSNAPPAEATPAPAVAAAAASPPAAAAPPTIESLQAQIAKQKETMRTWKESVKTQLMEAQSKNRSLKADRDAAQEALQSAENGARMRLEAEFKDRFASRDDDIRRLSEQLAAARAQRQADAEAHAALLERQKDQFQKESAATAADANATFNKELIALERQVAEAKAETEGLRHELSLESAKAAAAEARLRDVTASAAEAAAAEGSADRAAAQRLAAELEAAHAALKEAKEETEAARRRHAASQEAAAAATAQRVEEEVRQREDQLNVLHVLMRQSQTDAVAYQQRAVSLQGAIDSERDAAEAKLSVLRNELLTKMAAAEAAARDVAALRAANAQLTATVALLEDEKEVRERAFAEIYLSDDQKEMIRLLEGQLGDSQQRAAEAEEARGDLARRLSEAVEANAAVEAAAAEARASVAEREAEINAKLQRLAAQERRTREQTEQLAAQAERLRVAMGGAAARASPSLLAGGSHQSQRSGGAAQSSTAAPIIQPDEHGRLVGADGASPITIPREGSVDGGGEGTLTANIDAFISQLRAKHHWADVAGNVVAAVNSGVRGAVPMFRYQQQQYQHLSMYQQYRRLLPIIAAICFASTFFYYWLFSSTSAKAGPATRAAEVQETLRLIVQQYNALVTRHNACCTASPPVEALPADAASMGGGGLFRRS